MASGSAVLAGGASTVVRNFQPLNWSDGWTPRCLVLHLVDDIATSKERDRKRYEHRSWWFCRYRMNERKTNSMNNNEFVRAAAKVVLTGRREKERAQVVAEIKKLGGEGAFIRADVAKDADVKQMVDFTVHNFGQLDIAFNNAGVEWKGPLEQAT